MQLITKLLILGHPRMNSFKKWRISCGILFTYIYSCLAHLFTTFKEQEHQCKHYVSSILLPNAIKSKNKMDQKIQRSKIEQVFWGRNIGLQGWKWIILQFIK